MFYAVRYRLYGISNTLYVTRSYMFLNMHPENYVICNKSYVLHFLYMLFVIRQSLALSIRDHFMCLTGSSYARIRYYVQSGVSTSFPLGALFPFIPNRTYFLFFFFFLLPDGNLA